MTGMATRISSARFVGRERELTSLATALEAAAGGRASMLLVTGTGGVGVSRLLDEAQARLARLGAPVVVIRGAGTRSGRGDPYAPLVAGLAPLLEATPDAELGALVGPAAEELARLIPGLAARLAALDLLPEHPATLSAERRQAGVLEAFLGLLARLGERRPVVLVLEDLHLADAGTRAVATFLARIVRAQRLLVIGTYQPDELTRGHPFRADLAAMTGAPRPPGRLELGPLGRDELADLIEGIEGQRPSASVLLLVFLQLLAGCGTTPLGREQPLPNVPGGLLAQTPAPSPLRLKDGAVEISDALRNLRENSALLGECRAREQETHKWMEEVGLIKRR